MLKHLPRLVVTLALACTIGLHWAFLQSVAWTTMLVGNLTTVSFSEAVQRTFDGKHPCSLCKVVGQGKKTEKKSQELVPLKKFEAMNPALALVSLAPATFPLVQAEQVFPKILPHSPPTPPPRAA